MRGIGGIIIQNKEQVALQQLLLTRVKIPPLGNSEKWDVRQNGMLCRGWVHCLFCCEKLPTSNVKIAKYFIIQLQLLIVKANV